MYATMTQQGQIFLLSVSIGLLIGFVYDCVRILRRYIHHKNILIQLEDVLYWVGAAFLSFYIMLEQNDGEIRPFSIFATFLGIVLYLLAISPFVLRISTMVIDKIIMAGKFIFSLILIPVRFLVHLLEYPYRFFKRYYGKAAKGARKRKRYMSIKAKGWKKELKIILKKI